MKKPLYVLAVATTLALFTVPAMAWRPQRWVWFQWPYAYAADDNQWFYLNEGDTMYVCRFDTHQWSVLGATFGTEHGWMYYQWPCGYSFAQGTWYYLNESDTVWCRGINDQTWTLLGEQSAPPGMMLVPGGTNNGTNPLGHASWGDEEYSPDRYPQTYSLSVSSFYMDKYLVTKASWDDVRTWATAHGYRFDGELYDEGPHGQGKGPDHPVRTVNWYDCVKWCNARSEREGRPICYRVRATPYRSGNTTEVECDFNVEGYRLPTDAEWEYAARGGLVGQRYPWGNTIDHTRANYWSWWTGLYHPDPYCDYDNGYAGNDVRYNDGVQPYTSPVGAFAANDYGLSDMVGNMWQWCWDWHPGAYGLRRVKRGGAWDTPAHACRIGVRASSYPDLWHEEYVTYGDTGFRTVLTRGQ